MKQLSVAKRLGTAAVSSSGEWKLWCLMSHVLNIFWCFFFFQGPHLNACDTLLRQSCPKPWLKRFVRGFTVQNILYLQYILLLYWGTCIVTCIVTWKKNTQKKHTHTRTLGYLGPRATCLPAWHSDTRDPFKAAVEPPTSTTSFPLQTRSQRLTPPRRHRDKGLRPVTLFPMWQNQSVTHCQKHCYKRQPVEAFMCHTVIVHGARVQFSSTVVRPWSHVQTSSSNTVWDTLMFSIC